MSVFLERNSGSGSGWTTAASPPSGPSNGDGWFRTGAPSGLFIYDSTLTKWANTASFQIAFNDNTTIADNDWLGYHRLSAVSSIDRAPKIPFQMEIFSMAVNSTVVPTALNGVELYVEDVISAVNTTVWDGALQYVQEDISIIVLANKGFRCQANIVVGTNPLNTQCYLHMREVVDTA